MLSRPSLIKLSRCGLQCIGGAAAGPSRLSSSCIFRSLACNHTSITNPSLARLTRRYLSSSKEPEYQIAFDQHSPDPKSVQVPYLRDSTRVEMYRKHKEDPAIWTVEKLSQHYGSSIDRTNAVLYLMRRREEVQTSLGAVDVPTQHKQIYDKHQSNPSENTADVLAAESGLPVEHVHQILNNLSLHYARQSTLDEAEKHMGTVMAALEVEGVDTTFREIPSESRLAKQYTPRLFGDEEEEEAVALLRRLIEKDTRAKVQPSADEFIARAKRYGTPASEEPNKAGVKTDTLSRWKFAYRDTSRLETQPTMVRTRRGGWRVCTPLEESARSWSRALSAIDKETQKHKWDAYLDPDGDEADAARIAARKREIRAANKKAKEA